MNSKENNNQSGETHSIGAKTLFVDIETTPLLGYSWKTYDTSIIHVVKDWGLLSVAWKWLDSKSISVLATDTTTERGLTKKVWGLLDEADIVVAHNGDRFDIKKLQAKMKEFGMNPPSPFKTVDTLKVAKGHFAFTSNKLNDLGEKLGLGKKVDTGGFRLWLDCMGGSRAAFEKMKRYNKQDVALLEKLYLELRPWTPRHPNVAVYMISKEEVCSSCGSKNLQSRGYYHTNSGVYKRIKCKDCASWVRSRKPVVSSAVKNIVCDRK